MRRRSAADQDPDDRAGFVDELANAPHLGCRSSDVMPSSYTHAFASSRVPNQFTLQLPAGDGGPLLFEADLRTP